MKIFVQKKSMKLKINVALTVAAIALAVAVVACNQSPKESPPAAGKTVAYYTCPMHSSVRSDKPGSCSICGMTLVPVYTNAPSTKP